MLSRVRYGKVRLRHGHRGRLDHQAANGPSFDDAALKAFASKTLPVLQEHHKRVMQIEEKMGGSTAAR